MNGRRAGNAIVNWRKDNQWTTNHYTENQRLSNTDLNKYRITLGFCIVFCWLQHNHYKLFGSVAFWLAATLYYQWHHDRDDKLWKFYYLLPFKWHAFWWKTTNISGSIEYLKYTQMINFCNFLCLTLHGIFIVLENIY